MEMKIISGDKVKSSKKKKGKSCRSSSSCFFSSCFNYSNGRDIDDNEDEDDRYYYSPSQYKGGRPEKSVAVGGSLWGRFGLKSTGSKTVPVGSPDKNSKFDSKEEIQAIEIIQPEEKNQKLAKDGNKIHRSPALAAMVASNDDRHIKPKPSRKGQGKSRDNTLATILEEESRNQQQAAASPISMKNGETSHKKKKCSLNHKQSPPPAAQSLHVGSPLRVASPQKLTNHVSTTSRSSSLNSSKERQGQRHRKPSRRRGDAIVGMSVITVTLVITLFWGKICAILCTSAWLYFIPYLTMMMKSSMNIPESTSATNDLDHNSEEYKKKVILEGLLKRDHQRSKTRVL